MHTNAVSCVLNLSNFNIKTVMLIKLSQVAREFILRHLQISKTKTVLLWLRCHFHDMKFPFKVKLCRWNNHFALSNPTMQPSLLEINYSIKWEILTYEASCWQMRLLSHGDLGKRLLQWRELADTTLTKWSNSTSTSLIVEQSAIKCLSAWYRGKDTVPLIK